MPENTASASPVTETASLLLSTALLAALTERAEKEGVDVPRFLEKRYTADRVELDVTELAELATQPMVRNFDLNGRKLALKIRPLNSEEFASTSRILERVVPPMKDGKPDENDPKFVAAREEAVKMKRAAVIEKAVVSWVIPGKDLKEKADWLYTKFTPRLLLEITNAVYELTSDPIEHAVFC